MAIDKAERIPPRWLHCPRKGELIAGEIFKNKSECEDTGRLPLTIVDTYIYISHSKLIMVPRRRIYVTWSTTDQVLDLHIIHGRSMMGY